MSEKALDIVFEPLTAAHDVAAFTCTKPPLHDYLRRFALQNVGAGYSATTVAIDQQTGQIAGYFSLCATSVMAADLPPAEMKGMPKYPVPGVLLAKMAVHQDLAGRGLGQRLLLLAMREALAVGRLVGWRFFVVDAFDVAVVPFYAKFGFQALPGNPLRLYMNAKTVAKAVPDAEAAVPEHPMARTSMSPAEADTTMRKKALDELTDQAQALDLGY